MSLPTSPAEICSLATDFLKTEGVNNLSPAAKNIEALCDRWYDISRQSVLSMFPFSFAKTRTTLTLDATAPEFGYEDRYRLPIDFLSLRFISYEYIPLSQYDFVVEDGYILINNGGGDSLNIGYTKDVTDISKWTSIVKKLVGMEVAVNIAMAVTGKPAIVNSLEDRRKQFQIEARLLNGISNPPRVYNSSRIAAAGTKYATNSLQTYGQTQVMR